MVHADTLGLLPRQLHHTRLKYMLRYKIAAASVAICTYTEAVGPEHGMMMILEWEHTCRRKPGVGSAIEPFTGTAGYVGYALEP